MSLPIIRSGNIVLNMVNLKKKKSAESDGGGGNLAWFLQIYSRYIYARQFS